MDASTASALAGIASTMGNYAMNISMSKYNEKAVNKQNEWNLAMYQRQLADARDNWRMQNEYNSPSAQMKRLKEAGLNPNLIYGNGVQGASGNSSGMSSTPSAVPAVGYQRPMNMMAGLGNLTDVLLASSQVGKNNAEKDSIKERTLLTREQWQTEMVRRDGMNWANAKTKEEAKIWKEKLKFDLGLMKEQMRKFKQDVLHSEEITRGAKLRNDNYQMWNNSMSAMDYANLADRHELNLQDLALFEFRKQHLQAQAAASFATSEYIRTQNENYQHVIDHIDSQTALNHVQKVYREMVNRGYDPTEGYFWKIFVKSITSKQYQMTYGSHGASGSW